MPVSPADTLTPPTAWSSTGNGHGGLVGSLRLMDRTVGRLREGGAGFAAECAAGGAACEWFQSHATLWADAVQRATAIPFGSGSHSRFHKYLGEIVSSVRDVMPGEVMLVPVTWGYLQPKQEPRGGAAAVLRMPTAGGLADGLAADVSVAADGDGVSVSVKPASEGWASQLLTGSKSAPEGVARGVGRSEGVVLVLYR
eukprot:SAG22_NODE_12_length_33707_cov_70.427118_12_plen_197_part_01